MESLAIYQLEPLADPRWSAFLRRHREASIFHSRGWLQALSETYRYPVLAFTSTPEGEDLRDGVVFCDVDSRLTGRRLVSLPFSDHCQPLVGEGERGGHLLESIASQLAGAGYDYIELRPRWTAREAVTGFTRSETYAFHEIDLTPSADQLFSGFHSSSVQRRVRRAERAEVRYQVGNGPPLLEAFYRLMVLTRRRQGLPPQPMAWFQNLIRFLGEDLEIHLASAAATPAAAILTLRFGKQLVYKYGCSDPRYSHLGATPLLFWRAIQRAKRHNLERFDLGRSGLDNPGLIRFKSHWTNQESRLTYYRRPAAQSEGKWMARTRRVVPYLPAGFLRICGSLLYRHFG